MKRIRCHETVKGLIPSGRRRGLAVHCVIPTDVVPQYSSVSLTAGGGHHVLHDEKRDDVHAGTPTGTCRVLRDRVWQRSDRRDACPQLSPRDRPSWKMCLTDCPIDRAT